MHEIWVNTTDKIASFKEVSGFERRTFDLEADYEQFLFALVSERYRFQ